MMCKQIWFNNTLVKMFSEILKQLLLIFLKSRRLGVQPPVRYMVLIHNQHWHFQIFPLQRSSILKTLITKQLNVSPLFSSHLFFVVFVFKVFLILVAKIKNWLRKHQYISSNCYTRLILFFHFFNVIFPE